MVGPFAGIPLCYFIQFVLLSLPISEGSTAL